MDIYHIGSQEFKSGAFCPLQRYLQSTLLDIIGGIVQIGGAVLVTKVIFPITFRSQGSLEKALLFHRVEHWFA